MVLGSIGHQEAHFGRTAFTESWGVGPCMPPLLVGTYEVCGAEDGSGPTSG
jgi:hypothetical protein